MFVLFLILTSVSLILAGLVVRKERRKNSFLLTAYAIAVCDVTGCKHAPRFKLGDGVYVCACHL